MERMEKHHSEKEFEESMALIDMNHLRYEAPESVCATSNANRNQINFNPNAYTVSGGEQPSLLFNVGSSYTDGLKSMIQLTMTVNCTAPTNAAFFAFGNNGLSTTTGNYYYNSGGSVLNLFSEINHQSKSGELLYRELYLNQTRSTSVLYKIDQQRRKYLGVMGTAQLDRAGNSTYPLYPINVPVTFEIPLSSLSSFFGTSQLIPPMLLSGSIMRLTIAPIATALVFYQADGTTFATGTIGLTNISLKSMVAYLHQSELYDSVNSMLLSSANSLETNGLQYAYGTYFNTIYNPTASTFNFDIQLSAAKISHLILKVVPKNPYIFPLPNTNLSTKIDPMATASISDMAYNAAVAGGDPNALAMSWQIRLGNLVMPLFPITSTVDMFQQTCNALNPISFSGAEDPDPLKTINKLQAGTISYSEYSRVYPTASNAQKAGAGTGGTLFAFSFERSSAVNIGGLSSNNARILSVECNNMLNASNFSIIASVYYLQIANVSTDNVVVNK
jgi:hypothetical protein